MHAAAAATVTAGSSFAEWMRPEGVAGVELFAPWMFDGNGAAVILPAEAVGCRARYWPEGSRGIGELVNDDDGQAVLIPRSATIEEFRALVGHRPGRYKLIAVDRSFQFIERVPLVATAITPTTAARAGVVVGRSTTTVDTPPDTLGHVLAFVKDSHAHALEQIASLQRDLAEVQRQTAAQLSTVVGAMSGVLTAAGTAGVVKKSIALDAAAAGSPVTVQMMPGASNGNEAAPRNAAAATAAAVAADKSGIGEAALALLMPIFEKAAPMVAMALAKKMDLPDDYARDVAGMVQTTAHAVGQLMKPEDAPAAAAAAAPTAAGLVARVGRELMAHVLEIQGALPEADRAWVMGQMATRRGLVEAFKPAVASVTVEEGVRAVAALRAMDAALTTPSERAWFERVLSPELLPQVFRNLFVDVTPEAAIECVRAQAART